MKVIKKRISILERKVGNSEEEWEIYDPKKNYEEFVEFMREFARECQGIDAPNEPLKFPEDYPEYALRPPYKRPRMSEAQLKGLSLHLTEAIEGNPKTPSERG